MKRVKIVLVACVTLAMGLVVSAGLIGVGGFVNTALTRTDFAGPGTPDAPVLGALDYNANSRNLNLTLLEATGSTFRSRFKNPPLLNQPFHNHVQGQTPPNELRLAIRVLTDAGLSYVGNGVPSGLTNDFVMTGTVDVDSNGVIDPGESGVLLTGNLLQFGFNNLPSTPGNPGGTPDMVDFRFAVTGGLLASRYAGQDIGVVASSQNSTWNNANVGGLEFQDSFQGDLKGNVIPVTCGGTIGDFVWNDLNRNGVQDLAEPGLNGITVRLKDNSNVVIQTVVTAAGGPGMQPGFYQFVNLCLGNYSVEIDESSALPFVFTTPNVGNASLDSNANPSPVTMTSGNYVTGEQTIDFGFKTPCTGTIGNFVWHDLDRNGIQDPGEPGVPGVKLLLKNAGGAPIPGKTTMTDANGMFQFPGLCAGSYRVDVDTTTLPPGFSLTFTNVGPDRTVDSNMPLAELVALVTDFSSDATIDFGYLGLCEGIVGDYVWFDENHDGLQDPNEPGIDGLTITLDSAPPGKPGFPRVTTTIQNPNDNTRHGFYQFTGVCTGSYTVDVQAPSGFTPSPDNVGPDRTIDSNAPGSDPASVTLGNDLVANATIDFGFISCPGQIGDFVWQDLNLNGRQDLNEPGYSGVVVNLRRPFDNSIVQTTTTGLDGKYVFSGLCPADYKVEAVPPAGAAAAPTGIGSTDLDSNANPSPVTLTIGSALDPTIDFGFRPDGSIGDRVWNDANGDGVQDVGESGLAGWTVNIMGPNYTNSQVTGVNGLYAFNNLPAGTYTVCVMNMPGFVQTSDFDGLATPFCATRTITAVDLHATDVDFGFRQPALVGGRVWNDLDGDGVQDGSEAGLSGWQVNITGPNYTNSHVTGANGVYSFTGLLPGAYTVCVVPQSGFAETFDPDGLGTLNCAVRTVAAGENASTVDFGYRALALPTGSIGNFVWNDLNNNGIQEFLEPGLQGAPLTISGPNLPSGYPATQTTDANGAYQFTGLPAGTYTVTLPLGPFQSSPTGQGSASTTCLAGTGAQFCDSNGSPGGATAGSVSTSVTLSTSSSSDQTVDFGLFSPSLESNGGFGVIGNFVWSDLDGNGIQNSGEPGVAGVTVKLTGPGLPPGGLTTLTGGDGKYLFQGLLAGTYQVAIVPPAGLGLTLAGQGTPLTTCAGGTGVAACDSNTNPAIVILGEKGLDPTVDFGLVAATASIDLSLTQTVVNASATSVPIIASPVSGISLFTLTVSNATGVSTATHVAVTDLLPAGLTYVSSMASQGSYVSGTGIWTVGTLASPGSATLKILATVTTAGPKTNYAQVTAADQRDVDSTPNNNPGPTPHEDDEAAVVVAGAPPPLIDLSLTKAVVNACKVPQSGHFEGDHCDHEAHLNGHVDADGCDHEKDTHRHYPLDGCDHDRHRNGHSDGDGCDHDRAAHHHTIGDACAHERGASGHFNGDGCTHERDAKHFDHDGDDHEKFINGHFEGDSCVHERHNILHYAGDACDHESHRFGHSDGDGCDHEKAQTCPRALSVGGTLVFTLKVSNAAGFSTATNVAVTDLLPAGLTYVSSAASQGSYASGTGIWTVGTLASPGSATLKIAATLTASGPKTNYAQVTKADQPDVDSKPNNNAGPAPAEDDEALVVFAPAQLSLTKSVDKTTASPGNFLTYTLTYANTGSVPATNVTINDRAPTGTLFVSLAGGDGRGHGPDGSVFWNLSSVPVGATGSVTFTVQLSASFPTCHHSGDNDDHEKGTNGHHAGDGCGHESSSCASTAAVRNKGTITSTQTALVGSNTVTTTVTTSGAPVLTLVKAVDKTTASAGGTLVYTLTYANTGTAAATNVAITDAVPVGTMFVSATGGGVNTSGTVKWTVASLAAGATGSVTMTVQLSAAFPTCHARGDNDDHERGRNSHFDGDGCGHESNSCSPTAAVTNKASVKSTEKPTPVVSNTVTTTVSNVVPVLTLTKTVSADTVARGGTLVYTLTYKNSGTVAAINVTVADVLPANTSFVSATGGGVNAASGVKWTVAALTPGATGSVTVTVKVSNSNSSNKAKITNTGTVSSAEIATAVISNSVSSTVN